MLRILTIILSSLLLNITLAEAQTKTPVKKPVTAQKTPAKKPTATTQKPGTPAKKPANATAQKPGAAKTQQQNTAAPAISPLQAEYNRLQEIPLVKVTILDSIVCSESELTTVIPLPRHAGVLKKAADNNLIQENDFGDMRLMTLANSDGHYRIYRQEMLGNEWSSPEELKIDASFTDMRSPFLLADGQTLYFAAKKAGESNDSYCLYTSMIDTETGIFKKPQELPLPYRSSADDLYYIADETDSVAWFVTTRRQPLGKVCVYTIRTTSPWQYYEAGKLSASQFVSLAKISNISATWASSLERSKQLERLQDDLQAYDMTTWVAASPYDDTIDNFQGVVKRKKELSQLLESKSKELSQYRQLYHKADSQSRSEYSSTIISLEQSVENIQSQLKAIDHELIKR